MLNNISAKRKPLSGLAPVFIQAELAIANLEIPLTNASTATSRKTKEDLRRRDQYILKADPQHIRDLSKSGIDGYALGNNHALDYGWNGLKQTQQLLEKNGSRWTGAGRNASIAMQPARFDGKRPVALFSALAFMSRGGLYKCTPATGKSAGVHVLSFAGKITSEAKAKLQRWFAPAKKRGELVVVGLHWGIERQQVPSAYQVALGRACVDAGADIVWGHHPHVLQGVEQYRGKTIMYSLGNLIAPRDGETAIITVSLTAGTQSIAVQRVRIRNGEAQPLSGGTALPRLSAQLAKAYPHASATDPFAPKRDR